MARRLGKRKRPDREKHMITEQLKIEEGVFDNRTMMALWRMFNHGIISELGHVLKGGKEADIYLALGGPKVDLEVVVLKIFRLETSDFDKRVDYMVGDPRFEKVKNNVIEIVNTWCKKEFGNLREAEIADVHAPIPYYFKDNILAMEYISDEGQPARTLKNSIVENPDEVLDSILEDMKKLYAVELVHADISEYNILMRKGTPVLIDFGQAVIVNHPKAQEFLERDVTNILDYFDRKYRIERDFDKTLAYVMGK